MRAFFLFAFFSWAAVAADQKLEVGAKVILKWNGQNGRNEVEQPHLIHALGANHSIVVEEWGSGDADTSVLRYYTHGEYELVVDEYVSQSGPPVKVGGLVLIQPHTSRSGWKYKLEEATVTAVGAEGTILTDVSGHEVLTRNHYRSVSKAAAGLKVGEAVLHRGRLYTIRALTEDGNIFISDLLRGGRFVKKDDCDIAAKYEEIPVGLRPGDTLYFVRPRWYSAKTREVIWVGNTYVVLEDHWFGRKVFPRATLGQVFTCPWELNALAPKATL